MAKQKKIKRVTGRAQNLRAEAGSRTAIPANLLTWYRMECKHGDFSKLASLSGMEEGEEALTSRTFSYAMDSGKATSRVQALLLEFYGTPQSVAV